MLVKVALRREDDGTPVGFQAPTYFQCPCGTHVPVYDRLGQRVNNHPEPLVCVTCGQQFDIDGYLLAIISRPDNEDWKAMIDRISVPGRIAEVDEKTFWYFLEVLPPRYQRGNLFAFAEGDEPLRLFWEKDNAYFCRQFTWDETRAFCRLVKE